MGLSLQPERLKRYKDVARLLFKYGRSDLVRRAGLDEALVGESLTADADVNPEELATDLERLGPAFIKLGQLLSTRADLLPTAYLDALGRLQDRVEPFSFAEVERVIGEDLGVRISKAFATFDAEPMAAASLGQVHRAALRDGRPVAVKVQRPNIREGLAADLATMEDIGGFLDQHTTAGRQLEFVQMVAEFRRTLAQELDYQREAHNLVRIASNLSSFRRIVIPAPVEDFTSSRVLTMELIEGRKITSITPLMRQDFDAIGLARELFRAYLHQIIVDGFFHADPHPGNVLLTDDCRIALIDLGMVSRLSPSRQDELLKLLLAVSEAQGDRAAALALRIGDAPPDVNQAALRKDIQELVAGNVDMSLDHLQVGRIMMEISRTAGRHGIRLPSELTLLGKTLLNLDEVGRTLAPDFDVNAALRAEGPTLMQRRVQQDMSPANVFAAALETKEFLEQLPSRVNKFLDAATNNQLKVNIEVIDEGSIIDGLQKVANRITLGLLLAALIVGAAMLMRVETTFRLFGYPGFAMLFFLVAAAGGIWLVVTILTSDRPAPKRGR